MTIPRFLWQWCDDPVAVNPPAIFKTYDDAIEKMETDPASNDDTKLLAQSWKIFDNEGARRTTIDSRAAAMMPSLSLAATLVTGVGFSVLKDDTIPVPGRWIILAAFLLALVYLVRTMVLLFKILGKVYRSTLDPSDLPPLPDAIPSLYDRHIACQVLRCVVANYKANNIQSDMLFAAQHAFRNAVIVIVLGGAIGGLVIFAAALTAPPNPPPPGFLLTAVRPSASVWSMIRKSGYRFSLATNAKRLHGDHAPIKRSSGMTIRRQVIPL